MRKKIIVSAILASTGNVALAENYLVTEGLDDGRGLSAGTLSWAILQANISPSTDHIILQSDVLLTGVMKRLVDSNVTIQSDGIRRMISGNNQHRPLFIKSGQVTIQNIDIHDGLARGGDGGGAGMGGAIFVYDGEVNISDVNISGSVAQGGDMYHHGWLYHGGGGMFGDAGNAGGGAAGGGGLFGSASATTGGYGGYGGYAAGMFGRGGNADGGHGGFGGGGAGSDLYINSGNGGFGGGAGGCYCPKYGTSGKGGFGGAGGYSSGDIGWGASSSHGAGLGGAIFVRSGSLNMTSVTLSKNTATASSQAQGLGGGIFILHTTENSNGNNQGMPASLPVVNVCQVTVADNSARDDDDTAGNNDDVFDLSERIHGCDLIFEHGFEN